MQNRVNKEYIQCNLYFCEYSHDDDDDDVRLENKVFDYEFWIIVFVNHAEHNLRLVNVNLFTGNSE